MSAFENNKVTMRYTEGDFLAERLEGITTNRAYLSGYLEEEFTYSHQNHEHAFYRAVMKVPRLSGTADYIPIIVSDGIVPRKVFAQIKRGEFLEVEGRFTSYNQHVALNKNHVHLYLYVSTINGEVPEEEQCIQRQNFIFLDGTICKQPIFRNTPLGRKILDCIVAVNRKYGRADYIPCIAWGTLAERLLWQLEVGSKICFWGRVQSRTYIKRLDSGEVEERITREVSIIKVVER